MPEGYIPGYSKRVPGQRRPTLDRIYPDGRIRAVVNRIIPFSSVDGPGNRTAVFFQGCNINCRYCHNPETRAMCAGCGTCVRNCPEGALAFGSGGQILYYPEKCVQCDTCIHVCPHDSSPRTQVMTPDDVEEKVRKQIPFIRGISVSGGECMLRPAFLTELFRLAKADGLGTLIDSNGTIPCWEYPKLMDVSDGVMLDIKAFDTRDHEHVTGSPNDIVLENAVWLAGHSKLYEVRAVIVPDLYDGEKSVRGIAEYLAPYLSINDIRIKVIAYRPMGVREEYSHYQVPTQDYLSYLADIFHEHGFSHVTII